MIVSTSASSVAYCAGERTSSFGGACVVCSAWYASRPSSESHGTKAAAPAEAPSAFSAARRLTVLDCILKPKYTSVLSSVERQPQREKRSHGVLRTREGTKA